MQCSRNLHGKYAALQQISIKFKNIHECKGKLSISRSKGRTPTDVLNAIAKTVVADPTAPHFKYQDDSYLIPRSNLQKRVYSMSQESGRRAAFWLCQEHAALFQHSVASPAIKPFCLKTKYTQQSQLDEICLKTLIEDCEVKDATTVYTLMRDSGIHVSDSLKQSLLELLCSFNQTESPPADHIEERWFQQSIRSKDRQRKTWRDGGMAELLYSELEPDSQTYAAIIRGMCKYLQVNRAFLLYQEALEKEIYIDTETFNAIISSSIFLEENVEARWELCRGVLNIMNTRLLRPNLGTLNSLLFTISYNGNWRSARATSLKVLGEFKLLGIKPSLATWYYLLIIFCRERGPVSHILLDILDEIDGQEFEVRDLKDTYFFTTAMDVARNHLHDKTVAKRINTLLHLADNYLLVGDAYKESIYYRHFFAILCETVPIEDFMRTYDLLVPNVYTPEPGIMEQIVKAVNMNEALEYIPKLWSDIIIFDYANRESLVNLILQIISENYSTQKARLTTHLEEQFNAIAWDIYSRINEQSERQTLRLSFDGPMMGNIMYILSLGNDFEKAKSVLMKLVKSNTSGIPSIIALAAFVDVCVAHRQPVEAMQCLEFGFEKGLDCILLIEKIKNGFNLDESHRSKLKRFMVD